ncbi:MAG TPA: hypothetical protein VJ925_09150 [Longimicrobiales bacterium]|nr:hypothetical protein [Longimicrobiales bacterium]
MMTPDLHLMIDATRISIRLLPGLLLLVHVGTAGPASAQTAVPDEVEGRPCSMVRPLWHGDVGANRTVPPGAWTTGRRGDPFCQLEVGGWVNTGWTSSQASSRPDGLAAPAVGAVISASAGVLWRHGPLEVRVMPEVAWHQNDDVAIPSSSLPGARQYGYQWRPIDLPFRFGPDAFALIGAGRSGVRLHFSGLSVGLDAEPVRWGPSLRYPLLLSGQQASLPRVGLRTEQPFDLGAVGAVDFNLIYAWLTSSDWFALSTEAENRVMAGFTVSWAPGPLPGLSVGFSSLHHQDLDDFGLGSAFRYIQLPAQEPEGNSRGNGIGNLWVAWADEDVGLSVWAEWLKDDYNRNLTQLLLEPEKGSGRTAGLRQVVDAAGGRLSLHIETGSTRNSRPLTTDEDGVRHIAYTHAQVREGHTSRGQLLGAMVGPGGDGQFLEFAFARETRTAVQFERVRFNTDAYTEILGEPLGDEGYDVELVGRLVHERAVRDLRLSGTVEVGGRHNRLFLQEDPSWEGNVRLGLMLMWGR